jgi:hypothetical protein
MIKLYTGMIKLHRYDKTPLHRYDKTLLYRYDKTPYTSMIKLPTQV